MSGTQAPVVARAGWEFFVPHLRLRSVSESVVEDMSRELPAPLAKLLETDVDNFTFEKVATQFFKGGWRADAADPMCEVLWFDRGQGVQDECARVLTDYLRAKTQAEFIAVVFTALPKQNYYENGKHF